MFWFQAKARWSSPSWNTWKKRWRGNMGRLLVAVADSVFPTLDPARAVLSKIGAELSLAEQPTPPAIVKVARDADAVLVTYAKITADMIRQMARCRIIARFGIGVDNGEIAPATDAAILATG